MIHSILISEVKVTKTHLFLEHGKIPNKKLQSCILNSILTIFKKEKLEKFYFDCYDILIVGIDIIEFIVNTISELVFTIILYSFLFHILLEGEY